MAAEEAAVVAAVLKLILVEELWGLSSSVSLSVTLPVSESNGERSGEIISRSLVSAMLD